MKMINAVPENLAQSKPLKCFILIVALILSLGGVFAWSLRSQSEIPNSIFYYLCAEYEPFAVILYILAWAMALLGTGKLCAQLPDVFRRRPNLLLHLMAIFTFCFSVIGNYFIYQQYPLSMDEFAADFQARIFSSGSFLAHVPAAWHSLSAPLTPYFIILNPENQTWVSPYLPVYSLLRAPFTYLSMEALTNALLACGSLYLVAALAKKTFPGHPFAPLVAAGLLASSSQFQINSMSFYSMPAHLFFNLLWLFFFLKKNPWNYMAAVIGAFSIGLHQPHVHLLFAFPFFVWMFLAKEWKRILIFSVIYSLGLAACVLWWQTFRPSVQQENAGVFTLPQADQILIQTLNLNLLLLWNALPLFLFLSFSFKSLQKNPLALCLLGSSILTFAFYLFFNSNQGHGWGYRYIYPILGNIVLLALYGYTQLLKQLAAPALNRFTASALILSLLVLLPYRSWETYRVTAPFARISKEIEGMSSEIVLIENQNMWYGNDLIRNNPFLTNRPLLMSKSSLTHGQLAELKEKHSVTEVSKDMMKMWGLFSIDR